MKECKYNLAIKCGGGKCEECGWNPSVSEERIAEIRADIRQTFRKEWRQVQHGRWIKMRGFDTYRCSKCGIESYTKHNFCPNCGTDMRESIVKDNLRLKQRMRKEDI